jgi:hypothetical protein
MPWTLPAHFSRPDQSGQCREVKPGLVNILDIQLE